jgi:hypothetical protein
MGISGFVGLGGVSVSEGWGGGVEYEGVPEAEGCVVAWLVTVNDENLVEVENELWGRPDVPKVV